VKAKNSLTPEDKATILEHTEANHTVDVHRSETEGELMEVFVYPSGKPRYTATQINAAVSWVLGPNLAKKRVTEAAPLPVTKEDQEFRSPQKTESREKAIGYLVNGVPKEELAKRRFLTLPAQYTDDLDLMTLEYDIPPENIAAYILGDVPHASARFLRNCREYGVTDRHVGDMLRLLPERDTEIHGGYIDFFSNYGKKTHEILSHIPVPRDHDDLRFAINLQSSRENAQTSREFRKNSALVDLDGRADRHLYDFIMDKKDTNEPVSEARERSIHHMMFTTLGTSNEKNWLIEQEYAAQLSRRYGIEEEFESASSFDRRNILVSHVEGVRALILKLHPHLFEINGIPVNFPKLLHLSQFAMLNAPVPVQVEATHRYISPKGNMPFITCMAKVRTVRSEFEKCLETLRFVNDFSSSVIQSVNKPEGKIKKVKPWDITDRGLGSRREVVMRCNGEECASIKLQTLQDDYERLVRLIGFTAIPGTDPSEKDIELNVQGELLRSQIVAEYARSESQTRFIANVVAGIEPEPARNDRCPCCSGKKYKQCCRDEVKQRKKPDF